ncbi:MAG: ABC transporter permease [Eubacteriales bacterium]|nr:ABC transporter permease [Eubacteriales bacterium]MDD3881961.1 ABC transporter permease [Eubacteriales bacterium]MDD4513138.1 ABC transporter permease [Eubacteriales bacterium]
MLKVVFRKMMAKRWMMLALLIGNIMLVGIAAGNAMYSKAVLQRTLKRTFQQTMIESGEYPATVALHVGKGKAQIPDFFTVRGYWDSVEERFGVSSLEKIEYLYLARSGIDMENKRGDFKSKEAIVGCISGLTEHATFKGRAYSDAPDENGIVDAVLSRAGLDEMKLVVGDIVELKKITTPDGSPLRLRVVGMVERADSSDPYWLRTPDDFKNEIFISPVVFKEYYVAESPEGMSRGVGADWYTLLDYTQIDTDKIDMLTSGVQELDAEIESDRNKSVEVNFSRTIASYLTVSKSISVTLMVIQVPVFVLLFAFILMVSRQLMQMEQGEIAVLRSRGASRGEIFSIYLMQSGILAAVGFLLGMPTGVFLCTVLGSTDSFLTFINRTGMSVGINGTALIYGGVGAVVSMLTMVLPSVSYTRNTIVNHKQKKHGKHATPLWQKLFLDVIAVGIAIYALYTMNGQKALLAQKVAQGEPLDPLLFLASSLFMLGAGLFAVRLIPILVYAVYRPFKKFWSPAMYVSFLRVLRERASQGFIIIFLIMTLALGVFNAKAARTINSNAEENLVYTVGADIVLQEKWKDNSGAVEQHTASAFAYTEPDFTRYQTIEHVVSTAKVYRNDGLTAKSRVEDDAAENPAPYGGGDDRKTVSGVTLMAVNTRDFGNTINMSSELLPKHINNYLNAMAPDVQALIVSSGFRDVLGYRIGDVLDFYYVDEEQNEYKLDGIIYGFVDYWPGFMPRSYTAGADGVYTERQNYLIVAHLSRVQANWGTLPYEVWLKTDGASGFMADWAIDNKVTFTEYTDMREKLADTLGAPLIQSANGILTVGFIVVLVLCAVGFLIYWILSIRARTLQFGIFRAMGMLMREVITMLLNEQVFISGVSIALGTLVGFLTARLYMPLIQLAYTASDQVLPLKVAEAAGDIGNLFWVIGSVILIGMVILGVIVRRMNITQALKLGED